jgi:hypothetical protein
LGNKKQKKQTKKQTKKKKKQKQKHKNTQKIKIETDALVDNSHLAREHTFWKPNGSQAIFGCTSRVRSHQRLGTSPFW